MQQETVTKTKRKPTGAAAMGPGPGRPKGLQNAITVQLKNMILGALDDAGGQKYLRQQAIENPVAFMSLVGKVLPSTLNDQTAGQFRVVLMKFEADEPTDDVIDVTPQTVNARLSSAA